MSTGLEAKGREPDLVAELRQTPLVILAVAAIAAVVAVGSIGGGLYLMLSTGSLSLWAAVTTLVLGPTLLYLAYHLALLAHWAWIALLLLVGLLLLSSVARVVLTPGIPWVAVAEGATELAAILYLLRPAVRAAFSRRSLEDEGGGTAR